MTDVSSHAEPDVAQNLANVKAKIEAALGEAGRPGGSVTLTAVSKQQPEARIRAALDAGHRVFGENRVQEAASRWPSYREAFAGIELHLIGPLQSNKAKDAVELFDVIETVDRPKIAAALAAAIEKTGRRPQLLIQVNTGEEHQKAGVAPAQALDFLTECRERHGLEISGFMCIPPAEDDPAPHFALLAKLAAAAGLAVVSMGMSGDYEIAAQLGATAVRVGAGVFGPRDYS